MRVRVGAALLLIIAAAAAFNYFRPIPAVAATGKLPPTDVVPGTAPALPWPSQGAAAVGVSGLGFVASSGNEKTLPAASVTKVMTALIVLEDKPLKKDEDGPAITLADADVQAYQADLQDKQSVVRVEALQRADFACQLCDARDKQLDVHHRTYDRRCCEPLDDVIVRCHDCHGRRTTWPRRSPDGMPARSRRSWTR